MFQEETINNAESINNAGGLVITKDNNSNKNLWRALKKNPSCGEFCNFLLNLLVNFWFFFIINVNIILYNYFVSMLVVFVQIFGFYYTIDREVYKVLNHEVGH